MFAALHIQSFYGALLTALACSPVFADEKYHLLHGTGNLFVFFLAYLSTAGLMPLESVDYPISVLLFSPRVPLFCLPAAVVGIVLLVRARRENRS